MRVGSKEGKASYQILSSFGFSWGWSTPFWRLKKGINYTWCLFLKGQSIFPAHKADILDCIKPIHKNLTFSWPHVSRNSMKRQEMKHWKGQRGQWHLVLSRSCVQYIYTSPDRGTHSHKHTNLYKVTCTSIHTFTYINKNNLYKQRHMRVSLHVTLTNTQVLI